MSSLNKIFLQFEEAFWKDLGEFPPLFLSPYPSLSPFLLSNLSPSSFTRSPSSFFFSFTSSVLSLDCPGFIVVTGEREKNISFVSPPHLHDDRIVTAFFNSESFDSNEEALQTVLNHLTTVRKGQLPKVLKSFVTAWADDPFALGSYSSVPPGTPFPSFPFSFSSSSSCSSFISTFSLSSSSSSSSLFHLYLFFLPTGASDDDFNALSEREGRLLFAGEASYWDHFATVHGAFLSGKRAAMELKDLIH